MTGVVGVGVGVVGVVGVGAGGVGGVVGRWYDNSEFVGAEEF